MMENTRAARARLRGDESELFARHSERLVRLTQRDAGVPAAVAEDCAGFAFLQLCLYQPERDRIAGWLRVVARREALAWHHKRSRERLREDSAERYGRTPAIKRVPARLDVELAHEARELLRSIAALGTHRRTALTLRAAGYSYREIQQFLGVTYTWVNRHITEGRQQLRRADAAAEAEVEAALRQAA
jgi:RNA polymerase sigma factor (sigma-70 family)